MAVISSVQTGNWDQAATWDTGTVPTSEDDVQLYHEVQVSSDIVANTVNIRAGGSLIYSPYADYSILTTATIPYWNLYREVDDTRRVRLDGILLQGVHPCISCLTLGDFYPVCGHTIVQQDDGNVIIHDPGYIGTSANLQDIKPEGCAPAYARKVSNGVRYLTVSVWVRATYPHIIGRLYRMAESPFQVLVVTDRSAIKGYIESIVPDQSAVGTEYIALKVTITEGA